MWGLVSSRIILLDVPLLVVILVHN
jgi:hypothetical protein